MGNKAYLKKDFLEALDFYSKAIELDNKEPVYYNNSIKSFFISNIFN